METLYKSVVPMINSVAWKWAKSSGIDVQELIAEGNYCFVNCVSSFDETKGAKFSTYLHSRLGWEMLKYNNFSKEFDQIESEIESENVVKSHDNSSEWEFMINSLSPKTKNIIDLLRNPSTELQKSIINNREGLSKQLLKEHLVSLGWTHSSVRGSFSEIQEKLLD